MLKKLIKSYRIIQQIPYLLGNLSKEIERNKIKLQEIHAIGFLQSLNFGKTQYDAFTSFSMMPSTIVHILNDILINDRKDIIEFGSGNSTLYIARLIHHHRLSIQFVSIDQDVNWQNKIQEILKREGIENVVTFVYSPLKECKYQFKTQKEWYDTDILKNIICETQFDLIIVDAPTASFVEYARYPALPFLENNLAVNKTVIIDDTNRQGEKEIVDEWQKSLNSEFQHTNRYSYLIQGSKMSTLPIFYKGD